MSTTLRVQCSLVSASGVPEDDAVNVWHFRSDATLPTDDATEIQTALESFYNGVGALYNENTITGEVNLKFFDLQDASPRAPIQIGSFTIGDLSDADALPTECAIVMSFAGVAESGVNLRRRRGRIYLGPLDIGPSSTISGRVIVGAPSVGQIVSAADALLGAGTTWDWAVFSPTTAGALPWDATDISNGTFDVVSGWVDNAFDTQRRRGTEATSRSFFSAE